MKELVEDFNAALNRVNELKDLSDKENDETINKPESESNQMNILKVTDCNRQIQKSRIITQK